jgi:hypothetical protein
LGTTERGDERAIRRASAGITDHMPSPSTTSACFAGPRRASLHLKMAKVLERRSFSLPFAKAGGKSEIS